jgi:hypothetical protein
MRVLHSFQELEEIPKVRVLVTDRREMLDIPDCRGYLKRKGIPFREIVRFRNEKG